jgi:hypothetical protein
MGAIMSRVVVSIEKSQDMKMKLTLVKDEIGFLLGVQEGNSESIIELDEKDILALYESIAEYC